MLFFNVVRKFFKFEMICLGMNNFEVVRKRMFIFLMGMFIFLIFLGSTLSYTSPSFLDLEFNESISHTYYCANPIMGPSGDGVVKGEKTYVYPYTPIFWTYVEEGNISVESKPCTWRCEEGYARDLNRKRCVNKTEIKGDARCLELGCPDGTLYVASKTSKIYHKCDCGFAKIIKPENLICLDYIPLNERKLCSFDVGN